MNPSDAKQFNAQIYDEASEWFVEFRTGDLDPASRRRFNAWLRTSPEHVRAYLELAAIWHEGPRLDSSHKFDGTELIDEPNSNANSNVVRMPITVPGAGDSATSAPSRADSRSTEASGLRPKNFRFAAAASFLLVVFGAAASYLYTQRGIYSTDIGEQRSITLADGSRVEMNARSQVRVRFTDRTRDIELLEGQALFQVAKDQARPFMVRSGNTEVRAVGTQFDVYRRPTGTTVTVVEGRVSVTHLAANSRQQPTDYSSLILTAGEQVSVSVPRLATEDASHLAVDRPIVTEKANISAATAWTQNRLVFDSATLAEVADEFNRYNERRLVIESPELYDFHITGTFSSSDPASLLRFLKARPGIIVTEDNDEIRISR